MFMMLNNNNNSNNNNNNNNKNNIKNTLSPVDNPVGKSTLAPSRLC